MSDGAARGAPVPASRSSSTHAALAWLAQPRIWIALFALVVALGFLGMRGLWDHDEGRYTNIALHMLDSGNWLEPRRNAEIPHWTKPPLTYWAIAASIAVFGQNEFAARLPMALAYLLCVALAWRLARRLAPGQEAASAAVFASMLLPFGAAQLITTDFLLAAFATLAVACFVEARFGARRPRAWLLGMWAALGLAFLTKGPPALLPLLVMLVFDALRPAHAARRVLTPAGVIVFAAVALPWYAIVVQRHEGLLDYFIGREVVARVVTDAADRNAAWWGWIVVYVPTLLIGTLPWTPAALRWARTLPGRVRAWRDPAARAADPAALLLALWLLLPLLVFCLARSRMPLYVLPLVVPLALIVARQRAQDRRALPRIRWFAAWALALIALRLASAAWPTHKDASRWADEIHRRVAQPVPEVVFVDDMARYGVHLYLGRGVRVEKIALDPTPDPHYVPDWDESLAEELREYDARAVWIARRARMPAIDGRLRSLGFVAVPLGAPYRDRVIFRVSRSPAARAPRPR
jgi:4-amino-4-deoxy-L-arabinose transferase-like glycosyltransferase